MFVFPITASEVTRREQLAGKQSRAEEARAKDSKEGKGKGKGRGGRGNRGRGPRAIEKAIDKEANATVGPDDKEADDMEAIDKEGDATVGPNDKEADDMEASDKEADATVGPNNIDKEAIDKEADATPGVTSAGGSKPGKRKAAAPKSGPKAVAKKCAVLKKPAAKIAKSAKSAQGDAEAEGEFYDTFPDDLAVSLATQHSDEAPEDAVTAKPEAKKKVDQRKRGGQAKDAGAKVSKASKAKVEEPPKKRGRQAKVAEEPLVDEPAKKRGRKAKVPQADDPDVRALIEDEYVLPTQTFARRRQPNPTLSAAKWLCIRKAFERIVLPKLDSGSKTAQEECFAGPGKLIPIIVVLVFEISVFTVYKYTCLEI